MIQLQEEVSKRQHLTRSLLRYISSEVERQFLEKLFRETVTSLKVYERHLQRLHVYKQWMNLSSLESHIPLSESQGEDGEFDLRLEMVPPPPMPLRATYGSPPSMGQASQSSTAGSSQRCLMPQAPQAPGAPRISPAVLASSSHWAGPQESHLPVEGPTGYIFPLHDARQMESEDEGQETMTGREANRQRRK